MQNISRRTWLKQSGLAAASITMLPVFSGNAQNNELAPIRLHANENPYGPSPLVREAMIDSASLSNRYAFETARALREELGKRFGMTADHVALGGGSSEILGMVAQWAARGKGNIVTADPSFNWWMKIAEGSGCKIKRVRLDNAHTIDLEAMKGQVDNETEFVYVCNPNNPTGTMHSSTVLSDFVQTVSNSTKVLVDEAYLDFTIEPSLAPLIVNKNVIIARTFSKLYGLAGARIGFALAHPDTIKTLLSFQPWENASVSIMAMKGALAALRDEKFLAMVRERNHEARKFTMSRLKEMNIRFADSVTNFIFFSVDGIKSDYTNAFAKRNITVGRVLENEGRWARISIGTLEEMKRFCSVLEELIKI
jgi:histidinol-phosphate aminotransferase